MHSKFRDDNKVTRLNSENFYSMFKLMLQMEDEVDSKKSMSHDQQRQRVTHQFGTTYSIKIVIQI